MHCHDSYEIYYMITGNGISLPERKTIYQRPGSLGNHPAQVFPRFEGLLSGEEYHRMRVHFSQGAAGGGTGAGAAAGAPCQGRQLLVTRSSFKDGVVFPCP